MSLLPLPILLLLWSLAMPSLAWAVQAHDSLVEKGSLTAAHRCPPTIAHLQAEVEHLLAFLHNDPFKYAMRQAVTARLPEIIRQAGGLHKHIAFLQKEIALQAQRMRTYETIAREASGNHSDPLTACSTLEENSYCHAVEAFYTAQALTLVNQGFLDALLCYQHHGRHESPPNQ